ncbi:hypothetical protein BKA63DRAFT_219893 [Paraphoma chrysanthemicola]|nr:hypothetical protein BKA63DRAFT_219893 [Paraphoma chrysanthemicola]
MISNDLNIKSMAPLEDSWSTEARIGMATIFVMIILSTFGICVKHPKSVSLLLGVVQSWAKVEAVALPTTRSSFENSSWVSMADVRRYQQETYTSYTRSRRGPRPIRVGTLSRTQHDRI